VESEKNRFTIIVKAKEKIDLALAIDPLIQHGHVIEVTARRGRGPLMVNGRKFQSSATMALSTIHSTLPNGESLITVTAQNAQGG